MRTVIPLFVAVLAALALLQPGRAEDKAEKERRQQLEKRLVEVDAALEKEEWAVQAKQTIGELKKELEKAERIDVFRINPKALPEGNKEGKKEFHGYELLAKVRAGTDDSGKAVGTFLGKALHWNEGRGGACFNPRHGLRAVSGKRTLDFLICFACNRVKVFEDNELLASFALAFVEDHNPIEQLLQGSEKKSPAEGADTPQQGRKAVERGLAFLETDAAKWRKERTCATCHHGTMTVWALSEAKSQGYAVAPETLADVVKWTKERFFKDLDKPRDTRLGWNMVNTPAVYLAVMAQAVSKQDAISAEDLARIAGHLLRHQEADGSWAWSLAPAKNRPPPVFESDEVVTLMASVALGPHVPADPKEKSAVRDGREKAVAWLGKNKPSESTQATAVRLFRDVREGKPAKELDATIDQLLSKQNKDGGWGQDKDLRSDAYATGQALYFLSLAGVKPNRAEVQRAVAFLVSTQKKDGFWPMTSRAHPGEKPFTNPVPITYFGSAWATLGLLRSVSK